MPKTQFKKTQDLNPVTEARLEKLLSEQTSVILKTTNQKIDGVKKDMEQLLVDMSSSKPWMSGWTKRWTES